MCRNVWNLLNSKTYLKNQKTKQNEYIRTRYFRFLTGIRRKLVSNISTYTFLQEEEVLCMSIPYRLFAIDQCTSLPIRTYEGKSKLVSFCTTHAQTTVIVKSIQFLLHFSSQTLALHAMKFHVFLPQCLGCVLYALWSLWSQTALWEAS